MVENLTHSSPVDERRGALPRFGLALVCALHALPLSWAALVLPWRSASWFTLVVGLLALLHVAVLVLALASRSRALALVWKVLALYSLLVLAAVTWIALTSAFYLIGLYGGVGRAVAGGLFGAWAVCALLTLPISCWGLAHTFELSPLLRRRLGLGVGAAFVVAGASALLVTRSAKAESLQAAAPEAFERAFKAGQKGAKADEKEAPSLFHALPAACVEPLDGAGLTLVVTSLDREQKPAARCVQAAEMGALISRLQAVLSESGPPQGPALLDLVTGVRPLPRLHPVLDAFSLRPAHDGVCAERRCLAPWQLVALDAFGDHTPLPALRDARLGVSLEWLASVFTAPRDRLIGIETESYVLEGGVLERTDRQAPALERPKALASALRRAERHIVDAQQEDGAFRYTLEPFSGHADVAALNVPRQAGTALVLCELASSKPADQVARRALQQLSTFEQRVGDVSLVKEAGPRARLGATALPLVALIACRERLGPDNDELIARMTRGLLKFQREDGGFFSDLDFRDVSGHGPRESFYGGGQAVLALVLAEQLAASRELAAMPEVGVLRSALERAMDRYSSRYWPQALRDLFFLEENWHCLAARAALGSHRHDAYERFCSDYVAFKSRLILGEAEGTPPERIGGYSVSNVVPPHTTTSAGFAEALSAAIAVKRARGEDTAADEVLLKQVLGFVLRRQWTSDSCVACAPGKEAVGGFSESEASPIIRIDYVQHAMAALGHGGRVLGILR